MPTKQVYNKKYLHQSVDTKQNVSHICLVVSEHTVSQQLLDAVQSYGNTSVALMGGKEKEQNQHKHFLTKGIMIQAGTLS